MGKTKSISILAAIILLTLIAGAEAKDYSLESSDIKITIHENGIVNVKESINYNLEGCFHELYREFELPLSSGTAGPEITSITGHCEPECEFLIQGEEAIGRYPEICDTKATLFLDYNISNILKQYTDGITEFHYKIWGDKWEKRLERLDAEIALPENVSEGQLSVFFHPSTAYTYENGRITTNTSVPSKQYFEARIVFPSEIVSGDNSAVMGIPGADKIKEIESDYKADAKKHRIIKSISLVLLLLFFSLFPYLVYHKYGREPKINYSAEFEREPPTDDKPYIINSALNNFEINGDAFSATILDLVRRGYIKMQTVKKKRGVLFAAEREELIFELTAKPRKGIDAHEAMLLAFLKEFEENGKIELEKIRRNKTDFANFFWKFSGGIKKEVEERRYFSKKGEKIIGIAYSIFLVTLLVPIVLTWGALFAIMLTLISIIYFCLSPRVFGSFSKEGLLFYKKWINFKKFLSKVSLIKKYPPSSIVVWEKYLVYATAMGIAEEVEEAMEIIVPRKEIEGSTILYISAYSPAFREMHSFATATASGGVGGAGGGAGGGGGGAR